MWVVNCWLKSFTDASITFLNDRVDKIIMDAEDNICSIIVTPFIDKYMDTWSQR